VGAGDCSRTPINLIDLLVVLHSPGKDIIVFQHKILGNIEMPQLKQHLFVLCRRHHILHR